VNSRVKHIFYLLGQKSDNNYLVGGCYVIDKIMFVQAGKMELEHILKGNR
jgi:hypothetical protein